MNTIDDIDADNNAKRRKMTHNSSSSSSSSSNSNSNNNDVSSSKKRPETAAAASACSAATIERKGYYSYYHPASFVTWNCNGFSTRAKHNRDDLAELVRVTQLPDVICIQEARLRAEGTAERGRPRKEKDSEQHIRASLRGPFRRYTPFWSLADKKYAGTLTLVKNSCLESACVGKGNGGSSSTENNKNNNYHLDGRNFCYYDPDFVAFTPSSAIDLILRRFGVTREECGLDTTVTTRASAKNNLELPKKKQQHQQTTLQSFFSPKQSPTSPPPPPPPPKRQKMQTSLTSFFSPKKTEPASTTTTTNNHINSSNVPNAASNRRRYHKHEHTPEGRFQFFFFPGMDFVQTYVPNNGTKEESFARRRAWDTTMLEFVKQRKRILQFLLSRRRKRETEKAGSEANAPLDGNIDSGLDRKFMWCGDMNVAATYRDGSHWERRTKKNNKTSSTAKEADDGDRTNYYSSNDEGGIDPPDDIYEWFRDESKCLSRTENHGGRHPDEKLPENIGIPGFTPAERRRFATFVREGNFCDVWRKFHPRGDDRHPHDGSMMDSRWEKPNFTWRGALAKNFGGFAKYQGKGQRIDYFLLSPAKDVKEIQGCDICGYGTNKLGLFCGSDHCAVWMRFDHKQRQGN